ncbi:MAG: ABC transporter ATP-binding protein [Candidatus Omnitrophica bacterium]|nr:ABC transporter ATP-binding protein [Candidatus Omnitrophota bacterium]
MIIAKDVNKNYMQGGKRICAVESADITLGKGERVYIYGPSGAGKSTLLHILGGLSRPDQGEIKFRGGKNIYEMSDQKRSRLRNKHFGFIFQFYYLMPELTVLENVMLPALIEASLPAKRIKDRGEQLLKTVRMDKRSDHKPRQLSGGEIQRAAIARALINSPDVLFCDEPTGNLDSEMRQEIYGLIKEISCKNGMSVIVVSHHALVEDFFHNEYFMKDGRIERVGVGVRASVARKREPVEVVR